MKVSMARHLLSTISADSNVLNNATEIHKAMVQACRDGGATVIEAYSHSFAPQGVTAFVILAESHFSIHTWPEMGKAAIDIFTCGEQANPFTIFKSFCTAIGAKKDSWHMAPRVIEATE